MAALTTTQINNYAYQDIFIRKYYQGTIASDQLSPQSRENLNPPRAWIVNTDPQDAPGMHWCVFTLSHGRAYFFDPVGFAPAFYHEKWSNWLTKNSTSWEYNNVRFQSYDRASCGYFCLHFLYFWSRGWSISKILGLYSKNTHENDELVVTFVQQQMTVNPTVHCSPYFIDQCAVLPLLMK